MVMVMICEGPLPVKVLYQSLEHIVVAIAQGGVGIYCRTLLEYGFCLFESTWFEFWTKNVS